MVVVRLGGVLVAPCRAALHNLVQGAPTMRGVRFGVNLKCRRGGMWYDFRRHQRGTGALVVTRLGRVCWLIAPCRATVFAMRGRGVGVKQMCDDVRSCYRDCKTPVAARLGRALG